MEFQPLKWLLFAVISGLAALAANSGHSVYHDGLRPLMPEYRQGVLSHNQIGKKAFNMSLGFILFYALPFSLVKGIMVSHTIFLAADIIGVMVSAPLFAFFAALVYGFSISALIDLVVMGIGHLPVSILPGLGELLNPLGFLLGLMPVLAIFHMFGKRSGIMAFMLVIVVRWLVNNVASLPEGLTADGIAILVGSIFLLGLALRRKGTPIPQEQEIFRDQLTSVRKTAPVLLLIAACTAIAANYHWLAGEPVAALLLGEGRWIDAALIAIFSAVGFMPLVVSSSVVSGAYSTQGYPDWVLGVGYLAGSPIVAVILGVGTIALEVFGLPFWMGLLNRFPDLRELAGAVRDSMTVVTELALLVGGFFSANSIWPGFGPLIVGSIYFLNEYTGRPVIRLAIGPIGAIATGLLANLIFSVGLR